MRILLLNDKRAEREAMVRALPGDSFSVEVVGDEKSALAAIAREAPQILVFTVPAKGGADLARRLRGADVSGQSYQLALLDSAPPAKEIEQLVAAGIQDFMRRPVLDSELLERVNAPGRLLRWARSVANPALFDFSEPLEISRLHAWKNLGVLVAEDVAQLAGQSFAVTEKWPAHFSGNTRCATIPMSLAGEQLELRVSIVVDQGALSWLRETLLGDPAANDDASDDALRELVNTAGGALKRAALRENITLTTGLPFNDRDDSSPGDRRCWSLTMDGGAASLGVLGEIRKRANQRVPATTLSEGMVVAHDVRTEGGILLVPAGSRLTSTSAAKLAQMLGPRFFLEVAPTS